MVKASIRDVAKRAGVSITTVSRALNGYADVSDDTRKRIQEIAAELNYAPNINARSLSGKSNRVLAFLVSGLYPKDDSGFVFGIMCGLYEIALKNDYDFVLLTTNAVKQTELNYIQLCRQKNIEGLIISGLKVDDPYYKQLVDSEIPCVVLDSDVRGEYVVSLSIDNIRASYEAINYLIDRGHRTIAMINGKGSAVVAGQRYKGYKKALTEAGISVREDIVIDCGFSQETAYQEALKLIIKNPEITAFFCASDIMAIGVLEAIESLGKKVPEDYSIIGFDDIPAARYICGGLTTIAQSPYTMGKKGGEVLLKMIEGRKYNSNIHIPYEFINRSTVKNI